MRPSAIVFLTFFSISLLAQSPSKYPSHWWEPVPRDTAPDWEILPQDAGSGEVVLSKRNELGILSNFADTPFELDGIRYPSLEGFWQMMKYPENEADERATFPGIDWTFTREEVSQMVGFDAKRAGSAASKNMETMGINWVSYKGERMTYRTLDKGEHYDLIKRAMWAKLTQNSEVKRILILTDGLVLKPDHHQKPDTPPAWKYFEIWMEFREKIMEKSSSPKGPVN